MQETDDAVILIVDDNPINFEIIKVALRKKKYSLVFAENGLQAMEIARQKNLDLILLDIMMPEMDGFEVCEFFKKDPHTGSIPIIYLSALKDSSDKAKAFETGAVDYITKPISPVELNARVETHIRKGRLENELKKINSTQEHLLTENFKELQGLQNRHNILLEYIKDYLVLFNKNGHIIYISNNLARDLNKKPEQLQEISFDSIISQGNDFDTVKIIDSELHDEFSKYSFKIEMNIKSEKKFIEWTLRKVDGNVYCAIGNDITEYEHVLNDYLINKELFQTSPIPFCILSEEGRLIDSNTSFSVLTGYKKTDVADEFIPTLFFNIDRNNWPTTLVALSKKNNLYLESLLNSSGHNKIPVSFQLTYFQVEGTSYVAAFYSAASKKQEIPLEKKILNAVVETEEKEKELFAANLHNHLIPLLSTISLINHQIKTGKHSENEFKMLLNEIDNTVNKSKHEIRQISDRLCPIDLKTMGVADAIEQFIKESHITDRLNISTNFQDIKIQKIDKIYEVIIYRIVLELLNNTLTHANASNVELSMSYLNKKISIVYKDNGLGFDLNEKLNSIDGYGLKNIVNRLESIGAIYDFSSSPNQGIDFAIIIDSALR